MFSIGFEVGVWFWEVGVAEAKYEQHFAETENLTELNLNCYDVSKDSIRRIFADVIVYIFAH